MPDDLRLAGFLDARRTQSFLDELPRGELWVGDLSASADPDQALLQVVRLREADPGLVDSLTRDERARKRLCAIMGGSGWLGDYVIAQPARAASINEDPGAARDVLYEAVGAHAVGTGAWVADPAASSDDIYEDPPRTRQRTLILAAFLPWGGSDDTVTRRTDPQHTRFSPSRAAAAGDK